MRGPCFISYRSVHDPTSTIYLSQHYTQNMTLLSFWGLSVSPVSSKNTQPIHCRLQLQAMLAISYNMIHHNISILKSRLNDDSGIRYNIKLFLAFVQWWYIMINIYISSSTSLHNGL